MDIVFGVLYVLTSEGIVPLPAQQAFESLEQCEAAGYAAAEAIKENPMVVDVAFSCVLGKDLYFAKNSI